MKKRFDLANVVTRASNKMGILGLGANGESTGEGLKLRRQLYPHVDQVTGLLSRFIRNAYCMPQFAMLPFITLLSVYIFTFYESLGGSTSIATFFVALARCIDVIATPYISHYSDRFKGEYGRRRPFCFIGKYELYSEG